MTSETAQRRYGELRMAYLDAMAHAHECDAQAYEGNPWLEPDERAASAAGARKLAADYQEMADRHRERGGVAPPRRSPLPLLVDCGSCGGQHLAPSCLLKAEAEADCQF